MKWQQGSMGREKMRFSFLSYSLVGISAIMLSGCINGTRIQQDYIAVRDECREFSEQNYDLYSAKVTLDGPRGAKQQNAILAKIFSDCMYMKGWTVASPGGGKRPPDDLAFLNEGAKPSTASRARVQPGEQPQQGQSQGQQPPAYYLPNATPLPANRQPVNPQR